ncbi:MAG: ADP-ribosylglycohydrolase family protein, partial [Fibrobacteres bacterium]|nr:ADP-ribosylglycohydrolase family protein [Fibrobacterota bacterium]
RTAAVGLFEYWKEQDVIRNAENICKTTHYDPRCVGSSVILSLLISRILDAKPFPVEEMIKLGRAYDSRIEEYILLAKNGRVEDLKLDDSASMGYTLKTMAAGLWCYFNAISFQEGVYKIVNEGGDADTNGAVAGSILGAMFGFSSINSTSKDLVECLVGREKLERSYLIFFDMLEQCTGLGVLK